jgi:NADPH:quinone reductase-like Zn-dependent oxidoreductase
MRHNQVVLITAAAGGTGQFAVQLAKLAGNHVVATCSSPDKAAMLKRLGADRVINYRCQGPAAGALSRVLGVARMACGDTGQLLGSLPPWRGCWPSCIGLAAPALQVSVF